MQEIQVKIRKPHWHQQFYLLPVSLQLPRQEDDRVGLFINMRTKSPLTT